MATWRPIPLEAPITSATCWVGAAIVDAFLTIPSVIYRSGSSLRVLTERVKIKVQADKIPSRYSGSCFEFFGG